MKILIVGSNKSWAIERYFIKHLEELGADVHLYTAPDIIFDHHRKNILNKILFKTGIYTGYNQVNTGLIKNAYAVNPDIIWVFKGMEIYPSTLKQLGSKFKLANYNPDHPFIITSRGTGNKYVTESVGLYHLHFCYSRSLQEKIKQDFGITAVFLPFGYELVQEDYSLAFREPELKQVCFLGNPDKIREDLISWVAENGFPVDVYGHGWDKTSLKGINHVRIFDAVYGVEFWKKLRAYRVQLNIFREHNIGSHNMRTFEIPAVGGIQLTPYSVEQSSFFEENKEVFFYRNREEMLENLRKLMNMPFEQANRIREAARFRSWENGYSYRDRAMTVFKTFETMIGHA